MLLLKHAESRFFVLLARELCWQLTSADLRNSARFGAVAEIVMLASIHHPSQIIISAGRAPCAVRHEHEHVSYFT